MITRRGLLKAAAGLSLAAGAGLASGCAPGSRGGSGESSETADLAMTWWGNPTRNKNSTAAIEAYMKANPGVRVSPQPVDFAAYWDKLATQVAGNAAPDIIQMDMLYFAEYAKRGALLDLSQHGADTAGFIPGTVEPGQLDGSLYGVNGGINTIALMANPKQFEKAGMDLPDDSTWTWDSLVDTAAEVSAKAKLTFGVGSLFTEIALFQAYLRQTGKDLFTAEGLGFDAFDAAAWFDAMVKAQKAGAIGSAAQLTEETAKTLDQAALATGRSAMQAYWSNQAEALNNASGTSMKILRFPSLAGKATERKAWYKSSVLWTVAARSKNPDAAVALVNWWVNSPECAAFNLAERGIPANGKVQAAIGPKLSVTQKAVAQFITDIEPEVSGNPVAPPPGGGTLAAVMLRYQTDVLFGRQSSADAAAKFVAEGKANLQL